MKGLSLSTPMVIAWNEGRKDVTRRLMNPQPAEGAYFHHDEDGGFAFAGTACSFHKPRYLPGETVYIKEAHYLYGSWKKNGLAASGRQKWLFVSDRSMGVLFPDALPTDFVSSQGRDHRGWFKRSPRFMPAWAARSHARIVSVRPERIQEITGEDCSREGMEEHYFGGYDFAYLGMPPEAANFRRTWESLHPGSWEKNEFVWRIALEKVTK
jgi:hypothetical protein